MHLEHLWLTDFRSYRDAEFAPAPDGITVVTGANAEGKTNLLEAIGYLATLRSFRGSPAEAWSGRAPHGGEPWCGPTGFGRAGVSWWKPSCTPAAGTGCSSTVSRCAGHVTCWAPSASRCSPRTTWSLVKGGPAGPAAVPRRPAGVPASPP